MMWNCLVSNLSHVETLTMKTRLLPFALLPAAAFAQAPVTIETKLAALEAATKSAQSAGDNAWMLTSSALVLMMTAPGLALFYGGLVRKKNVLAVLMQCIFLMGMMSVVWALWGYSFAFGGTHKGWIGGFSGKPEETFYL